jgi:CRISPR-associated protein Cas5t
MDCLYLQASFAAFRQLGGGRFQCCLEYMPPSTAYGLLLNIAGIEMRNYSNGDGDLTTSIKTDLPKIRMAIGLLAIPQKQQVVQQLHKIDQNPPKGDLAEKVVVQQNLMAKERPTEKEKKTLKDLNRQISKLQSMIPAKGCKYTIYPVVREFLYNFEAYICFEIDPTLKQRLLDGLDGKLPRYGLPFLGDNNFFLNQMEIQEPTSPAYWVQRVGLDSELQRIQKLPITIDRLNSANTKSALFGISEKSTTIPETAWVEVGY